MGKDKRKKKKSSSQHQQEHHADEDVEIEFLITTSGWEDGEPVHHNLTALDRWVQQSADSMEIKFGQHVVHLYQDPHSNQLGGYIWDCSFILCSWFTSLTNKKQIDLTGKKIVEVGAGVGLVGILVSKLGANVIITDIPEVMPKIERNIKENHCTSAIARALTWGQDVETTKELAAMNLDYILAVDCIYSEANARALVEAMFDLATKDTIIYCMTEIRNQSAQDTFISEAQRCLNVEVVTDWQPHVPRNLRLDYVLFYKITKRRADEDDNNRNTSSNNST